MHKKSRQDKSGKRFFFPITRRARARAIGSDLDAKNSLYRHIDREHPVVLLAAIKATISSFALPTLAGTKIEHASCSLHCLSMPVSPIRFQLEAVAIADWDLKRPSCVLCVHLSFFIVSSEAT